MKIMISNQGIGVSLGHGPSLWCMSKPLLWEHIEYAWLCSQSEIRIPTRVVMPVCLE